MFTKMKNSSIGFFAVFFLMLAAGALLGSSFFPFFRWYLLLLIIGAGFFPLTRILFAAFRDGGWLFSRVIGLAAGGYAVWVLGLADILRFTGRRALVVTLIFIGVCWVLFMLKPVKKKMDINLIIAEEVLFFGLFVFWAYLIGFRPQASGTEKFMDYGFMAAMYRSTSLPAKDIWYGTAAINYYYGGQYFGVYLGKMCGVGVSYAYNIYRAMIAALGFALPFSIVRQMVFDRMEDRPHAGAWAAAGGLIGGAAVSLAGNGHYVIYGIFGKLLGLPMPDGRDYYWFADSTRYIGYNPVNTADRTIHEFPSYSFVLGDVHAHMCNIIFVLTVVALLYAWICTGRENCTGRAGRENCTGRERRYLPDARFLSAAALIGMFQWTNFWDYVIYFTVAFFCIIFCALNSSCRSRKKRTVSVVYHTAVLAVLSTVTSLPFRLQFQSPVSGVAFCRTHTPLYQLLILWGFPFVVFLLLIVTVVGNYRKKMPGAISGGRNGREGAAEDTGEKTGYFRTTPLPDHFALTLGLCAFGLVLVPEIVYVRDIYESSGYPRSNTMFKMTYQAFILYGMMMAYAVICFLASRQRLRRIAGIAAAVFFGLTLGYFPVSVRQFMGNIFRYKNYQGLDATSFLESSYPADAGAIRWLNENVPGQPVVLEADGDSYSTACRVSAMTGLPTVLGWYVQEWLWRSDPEDLNQRSADIKTIYTSDDAEEVRSLIEKYGVSYIFVGSEEYAKYGTVNTEGIAELGEVVYSSNGTFIVKTAEG